MISCPHCEAENKATVTVCLACGKELVPVVAEGQETVETAATAANEELPSWLLALKPDHLKEESDEAPPAPVAVAAPSKAEPIAAEIPAKEPAMVGGATSVAHGGAESGKDTLVATQPTVASRPKSAPKPTERASRAPEPKDQGPNGASESASLISEDDLPAWLRAFSEPDTANQATKADDQSWMLGGANGAEDEQMSGNLAQSWQAPARATAPRTGAVSVFGTPDEAKAKVAKVAKPERVMAPAPAPTPAPAMESKLSAPLPTVGGAKPTTPARLGANRPAPAPRERSGPPIQRMATIAFIVAFLIFLVVMGIFVIGPMLAK